MTAASHPPPDLDPESVHQVYVNADVRPAIHAATHQQLKDVLHRVSEHLCQHLSRDIATFPAIGPDRRRPWEICQIGAAMPSGFQLYHQITTAMAGSYLRALGFVPASAASDPAYFTEIVAPFLATARKPRLRRMLLNLTGHISAVLADSDTSVRASTQARAHIPGETWEIAAGVTAAISLYRHCAQVISVHVRFYILDGLGIGNPTRHRPYTPAPPSAQIWPTTLN